MHVVYPTGRPPFDHRAACSTSRSCKTFEERAEGEAAEPGEGAASGCATCSRRRRPTAAALDAAKAGDAPPKPDLPMEALAPVARGELPVVMRADDEDGHPRRGHVRGGARPQADHRRRPRGLALRRPAQAEDVAVLLNVDRLPRRESDPYDAAYANPAALHAAGVRFAIVTDDASPGRATCPTRRPWRAPSACPRRPPCARSRSRPAEIFGVADRMGSLEVGQGRQPVRGHRRHHGPPHRGHPRLHRRRAAVAGDAPHPAVPASSRTAK